MVAKIQVDYFKIPIGWPPSNLHVYLLLLHALEAYSGPGFSLSTSRIKREQHSFMVHHTSSRHIFHKIAQGQSITSSIFFVTFRGLLFKMLNKKIYQNFVVFAGVFQVFVIFYPYLPNQALHRWQIWKRGSSGVNSKTLLLWLGFQWRRYISWILDRMLFMQTYRWTDSRTIAT